MQVQLVGKLIGIRTGDLHQAAITITSAALMAHRRRRESIAVTGSCRRVHQDEGATNATERGPIANAPK